MDSVERTCQSGTLLQLDNLSGGPHQFVITATDLAGNARTATYQWSNVSCNPNDVNFINPLAGKEGVDWALLTYVDVNPLTGMKTDWAGSTNDFAKVYDGSGAIEYTTGDFKTTTTTNHFAKVIAAADGEVVAVVNDKNSNVVYSSTNIQTCLADTVKNKFNFIKIKHVNGFSTTYERLQKGTIPFVAGAKVKKGDLLGYLGASGCNVLPRLRFITRHCDNRVIDPLHIGMLNTTYSPAMRLIDLTLRSGSITGTPAQWNTIITAPAPVSSYKVNTQATITALLTSGKSSDLLMFVLVDPNGRVTHLDAGGSGCGIYGICPRGNSVGKFILKNFLIRSSNLQTPLPTGQWVFKAIHILNADPQLLFNDSINPIITSRTFTVTN